MKPAAKTRKGEGFTSIKSPSVDDPESVGKNKREAEEQESRWFWLLAPDGSPSTAKTIAAAAAAAAAAPTTTARKSENFSEAIENSSVTKTKKIHGNKSKESDWKGGSWCWLVSADGNYSTVANAAGSSSSSSSASPATRNSTKRKREDRPDALKICPVAKRKAPDGGWKQGSWCWLLASDGNYSTINHSTASSTRKRQRKGESGSTLGEPLQSKRRRCQNFDTLAKKDTILRRGETKKGSWCWLLRKDGSYATVSNTPVLAPVRRSQRGIKLSDRTLSINEGDEYNSDTSEDDDFDDGNVQSSSYSQHWEEKFQLLVAYKNKYNTTNVNTKTSVLGTWVKTQRSLHKRGRLSKQRMNLLESIGFQWRLVEPWEEKFQHLVAYQKKYNTTNIKTNTSVLGTWVGNQRYRYTEGKLSKQRINLLESIGFEWRAFKTWIEMYNRLVAYKKKYMTTRVPVTWNKDPQLGRWVRVQRFHCKEKDRVDLLNDINFEWRIREHYEQPDWMEMYNRLVAYKKNYKATRVPYYWNEDPQLAHWVNTQRRRCKKKDRIDLLNNIGFVWDARK